MPRSTDISPLSVLLGRVDAISDGSPVRDTITSGFPSLVKVLAGGFRHGDLIVLGGDVSSGKSALALAFATRAAQHDARVAFLTGEGTVDRTLERIIAIEARTRVDDLRQGTLDDNARASAGAAALRLRERLPIVERVATGGCDQLAKQLDSLPPLDLIVIDPAIALLTGQGAFRGGTRRSDHPVLENTGAGPRRRHIGHGPSSPVIG